MADESQEAASISREQLVNIIDRIESLEGDKQGIADDIKDVYSEAKSLGYETKIIRQVVKLRKISANRRREEEELLEIYMAAIEK